METKYYGDRDPISAGSVGEAVGRGGSMAVMGMSANPIGAHQVVRHMVDRMVDGIAFAQRFVGACRCWLINRGIASIRHAPSISAFIPIPR
ncbi:MAG: hypothetical protein CMM10_18525 [Rhodospirillaceae bacterium]|nr:hypothetical protein [Rhodospirillaceae bacterium]